MPLSSPAIQRCRIYLVTPRIADHAQAARLALQLTDAAATADIACVLLRCREDADKQLVRAAADRLRPAAGERDIALLLDGRADLVRASGADGVHLACVADYADARRHVGDGIVGVGCASRHDAMSLADAGADYVAFGDFDDQAPASATITLTEWWAAVMTVPCVAAGGAGPGHAAALAQAGADYISVSDPGWSHPAGLRAYLQLLAPAAA